MATVKKVTLSFPPSGSPDVVGYRLYMVESPEDVEAVDEDGEYLAKAYELGLNTEVDLSTIPGMTSNDGVYNLGVTAVDDAANESSMSVMNDVPLDFVAPDAPGMLTIVRE